MESEGRKGIVEHFLRKASGRWGEGEVEEIKPQIERTAEAVWRIRNFELEPNEEPWTPLKKR